MSLGFMKQNPVVLYTYKAQNYWCMKTLHCLQNIYTPTAPVGNVVLTCSLTLCLFLVAAAEPAIQGRL